jgi:hypothetical protein
MFLKAAIWMFGALALGTATSFTLNFLTRFSTEAWPISLLFFVALFLVLAFVYGRKKNHVERAPVLIGGFVVRFLSGLVFLLVFSFALKGGFLAFSIHFIAHWLLFTLAEIAYLSASSPSSAHI